MVLNCDLDSMSDTPLDIFWDTNEDAQDTLMCLLQSSGIEIKNSSIAGPQSAKNKDELIRTVERVLYVNRLLVYYVNSKRDGTEMLTYFYRRINGNDHTCTGGLFPAYIPNAGLEIDGLMLGVYHWHEKRDVTSLIM